MSYESALAAYARSAELEPRDDGANEAQPKPCCTRLPTGDWCLLPQDHGGDCNANRPARLFARGTDKVFAGLVRCARCGQLAKPLRGHLSIHFGSGAAQVPCPSSWPPSSKKIEGKP